MKEDIINACIKYISPSNLENLNKKYGSTFTKDQLYLKPETGKSQETFCLHITDLHYGKKTDTYSISKCCVKIHRLISRLQTIVDIEKKSRDFDQLCIFDTGDMVDGFGIYPTQTAGHLDEPDTNEQAKGVVRDFYDPLIEFGLKNFPKVKICKVPGNHGRRSMLHAESDNLDVLVTDFLNFKWSRELRVTIEGGKEKLRVFQIGGHRIALFHGDYTTYRGVMSLPYYKLGETASMWNVDLDFDFIMIGHFHQVAMIPLKIGRANQRIYLGGTMATGDDYSTLNFGRDGMHEWWYFGLHGDRKSPTFMYTVDLA